MPKFIVKRILQSLLVLICLSFLVFVLSRAVPGDPARLALGPRATEEAVASLRRELNLDKPVLQQFCIWLRNVLQGDFGNSVISRRAVLADIKAYVPVTVELIFVSALLIVIFSLVFGLLAARYKNTWVDGTIRIMAYLGVAVPSFVWSALFLLFFGFICPLIPVLGRLSPGIVAPTTITGLYILDGLLTGNLAAVGDAFAHLFLPALALAIAPVFQEARILRSSIIDNSSKEYIKVSEGYGHPKTRVMGKYLLKPSFPPVLNVMGLDMASLFGNAFLAEIIFNLPGISRYSVDVMISKDLNAISAVILIIGALFLAVNLVVDLICAMVDPRIRLGG